MSRCLLILAACGLLHAQERAVIEVDASSKAGYQIPRTIYGTFLEPIGRSIYGGLWAQLLENPSLEENLWSAESIRRMIEREPALAAASRIGLPLPWEPLHERQGWRYEPRWGDAANGSRALLLMGLPGTEVGVRQQVYLPVHRVLRYGGSLSIKPETLMALPQRTSLHVSLRKRNQPGEVLASIDLPLRLGPWRKYEFKLELEAGRLARLEPADLVISLRDEARVFIDQVFLFPADHVDGMDPEMIAMSKALLTPVIRFGGNFTSGYHWEDGVGPLDKRISKLNQSWGMPEYNHFGTAEFLKFCRHVGAVPQICLNLGSGTPQEAAGWVRYVNQQWNQGKGGLLWELGNELWGNFQIGYPTQQRLAPRTRLFSAAVRAADPNGRWIATGQDPDHFHDWNAAQLDLPSGSFHYLATHFVVGTAAVRRKDATPDFVAASAFALPVGLERKLREMKAQIDASGRDVKIAFTEWLFHGSAKSPRFDNMGGAVCTAGFLNTLMRTADFVPLSDMTGLIEFGGVWKKRGQVFGVPAYWAFRMYSTAGATQPVAVRTAVARYDVADGNTRIPEIGDVPYLDVVAALNAAGDKLMLFVVSRRLDRETAAEIRIHGFEASGDARALTLSADSIYASNTEEQPEAVKPVDRAFKLPFYSFPPASVTVLTLVRTPPAR